VLASGALAACGGSDPVTSGSDLGNPATGGDGSTATDGFTLVQRFPQATQGPGTLRLPISLSTGAASLIQDGPLTLGAQVVDIDGKQVGGRIEANRRDAVPAPYYDFRPAVNAPGIYALQVDGGPPAGASFDVADPAAIAVPAPGQALAPFDTPTFDDPAGVDPICTRDPEPCPFHEVTLTAALAAGKPVVYYVGTPAFCETGSCAPGLESIIELQPEFGEAFTFVHTEVYIDNTATALSPAMEASGLTYEPAVFVTDASGVILERLDAVWNTEELAEMFERSLS
jgi:hypothetical protein